jgi:hypothetical protein
VYYLAAMALSLDLLSPYTAIKIGHLDASARTSVS